MKTIKVGKHLIGPNEPVYVIAEAGVNHEESIETAEKMIVDAARTGAQCIKFQTYQAGKLVVRDAPKYWDDPDNLVANQYEMFAGRNTFNESDWQRLIAKCEKEGITFMSSAWDEENVDMLDALGMPAFKIGSADITSLPLISYTARKGKPIILSTGASTIGEIEAAVEVVRAEGNEDIILLHCILSYPADYRDANLKMMVWLQQAIPDIPIGLSDHTLPDSSMTVPLGAAALGARVIEKHYTLDKTLPGNDHYHAMDTEDLGHLMASLDILQQAQGNASSRYILSSEQIPRAMARRSLVSQTQIPRGTVIERDMITYKRPGTGISPADLESVLGRCARVDIPEDKTLTWDMV
jgi:N-acetylneuraminate synthase